MMTREEAANWVEAFMFDYYDPMEVSDDFPYEVAEVALSALRPVSREQVEKVWRGEWIDTNHRTSSCKCTKCGAVQEYETPFCPACGASMTDEAVEMVMERLEALYGKAD